MNAALAESIEVLPPAASTIAEFNQTEAGLAALRAEVEGMTFDCSTTAGDKEARRVRMSLVSLRTTIEAKRVELKMPLLERGRVIDAEAKRIIGEVKSLEDPIDRMIRDADAVREAKRQERERQDRELAERAAALRAEEESHEAERKAEQERMEAETIANATLRTAAEAAFILLDSLAPEHLVTRALGAALERDA